MSTTRAGWADAWRIASRDLNARFRGLRLLLVCLFLGTGALAAIGTLTASVESELEARGQELLGGDLQAAMYQRDLTEEERKALYELGEVSTGVRLQAVARAGQNTAPVGVKGVDERYPLYGTLTLKDGRSVGAPPPDTAWLAQGAIDRLGIEVGDTFQLGTLTLTAGGIIDIEPDRLGEGFQLGPTIIVAQDIPARAGLTEPGSMFENKYRVRFDDASRDPQGTAEAIEAAFPASGLELRTSERASPGADRFVGRMGEFLTLVGLAALVIAGIGIAGGVRSYLEARRRNIATLKILGATSRDIARIYALQIGAAALAGSLAGLLVGLFITPILAGALQGLLPVGQGFFFDAGALALALLYGLLVAFVFSVTPLMNARRYPAMALMRARVTRSGKERQDWLWVAAGLLAIIALVLATSSRPLLAASFIGGAVVALALLALLGWLIRHIVKAAPRPGNPIFRNALANLHRPGANTTALVTALGFGLAAFVCLAAIQTSIDGNIDRRVPDRAPDYFALDIPPDRIGEFEQIVREFDAAADIRAVPNLRGSVIAYGPQGDMTRVSELEELPDGAWGLRGERGLTYADTVPPGNTLTTGEWWASDGTAGSQVSVSNELADAIGLQIGDNLTISVLGVERTAEVTSFREIDWDSLGFNHVFVFSPQVLQDAPHNLSATIDLAGSDERGPLLRALVNAFPSSSVIEVGGILEQARDLLSQVGLATLTAASVAVLAGLAVLIGAIAAARASRTYDTVVLRVLGADRRQILTMQLIEYGILTVVLTGVALAIGSSLAWLVITQLFEFDWLPHWPTVIGVLGLGLAAVFGFSIIGSLPLLRARPAQALRAL